MKILFLNAYFRPESVAYSHLENDLIEGLLAAGHEISVISPVPTRGLDKALIRAYQSKKKEQLYDGRVQVQRFWAPQEGRNPLVRAFRYLWCNLREYQIAKKYKDVQLIFAASTPPTQGMLCGLVKKRLKVPFVYNLQDIFPDSLTNAKMAQKDSFIWKIGRKIEDFTYRSADKIIVISEDFKRNIMEKGVPEEKIVVVPNWVDTEQVYPVAREDNVLFDRYQLDRNKFYVCYSGNLGHSQNLRLLLDVARMLKTDLPDMRFVLIGDGAAKEELLASIRAEAIDNVIVLPFQPYEDIAYVFSLGDVGLIISKPGIGGSSVPSKTWSIMAAARPIVASFDENSELARIIREQDLGAAVKAGEIKALADVLTLLFENRKQNGIKGQNGRKYLDAYCSKAKCVAAYVEGICSAESNAVDPF